MARAARRLLYALLPAALLFGAAEAVPYGERAAAPASRVCRDEPYALSMCRARGDERREGVRLSPDGRILYEARIATNRHGLRGPDFAWEKAPGARRVLAVGDSVAFGWGVSDGGTYADLLREAFARSSARWEVLNAGVPGFTSVQTLAAWRARLRTLRPDALVMSFCHNDAQRWTRLTGAGVPRTDAELIRLASLDPAGPVALLRASTTARALSRVLVPAARAAREWSREEEEAVRVPREEFREATRALIEEARAAGAEVFVLKSGCEGDYGRALLEIAAEERAASLDVMPACAARKAELLSSPRYASRLAYYRDRHGFEPLPGGREEFLCTLDRAHLSRLGHLVVAEALEGWLAGKFPEVRLARASGASLIR